jgi:hypothetical protein
MSIKVMTWVWENSKHKGSELLLLLAIADHAHDDGGGAYPGIKSLARKIRMTDRNVNHLLVKMQEGGELIVLRGAGPNGVNLYRIMMGGEKFSPVLPEGVNAASPGGEPAFTGGVNSASPEGVNAASPKPSLESSKETSMNQVPALTFESSSRMTEGRQRAIEASERQRSKLRAGRIEQRAR